MKIPYRQEKGRFHIVSVRHTEIYGKLLPTFTTFLGKSKGKFSLCLTKHHGMKAYWGRAGIAPRILDLCTRWN
jgi:hypothetical protein